MKRGNWAVLICVGAIVAACGSASTKPRASQSIAPSPSAATSACASVRTTTPIDKVSAACAALWQPYQVTMVPPPDVLKQERVPSAPPVKNMTNGAVSQGEAQHWADANNWDSGWLKWADAVDQPLLLTHIAGPALIAPEQQLALQQGASVRDPDCIYPTSNELFPLGPDGKKYFAAKGLPVDDAFVFVVTFAGPCASTATFPDGHSESLPGTNGPVTAFVPGTLRHDPLLGDVWFTDAGGGCNDSAGPPGEWCGR